MANDLPANDAEEFSWITTNKSNTGDKLASGDLPGEFLDSDESDRIVKAINQSVADTDIGINIQTAMMQTINNIMENNPDIAQSIADDIETYLDENNIEGEQFILDEEQVQDVRLLVNNRVEKQDVDVSNAVVAEPNQEGVVAPINPRWHSLVNVNREFAGSIRRLSNQVFSIFPCYEENIQQHGQQAADNLNVLFSMDLRENANHQERQVVNALAPNLTASQDIEAMANWISRNGVVVDKSDISFNGLTPNNYSAKIVMSVTEDRTFLLVKEDSGFASYNYNAQTGDFIARVKPGKTINNGELLKVLDKPVGDEFNFNEGSGLSVIRLENNEVGIVYDGYQPLTEGHEIRSRIENFYTLNENMKLNLEAVIGTFGDFSGREKGVSPVDAKYIYSWEGGRQHYLDNPESQRKLSQLFSQSKIVADMQFNDNRVEDIRNNNRVEEVMPREETNINEEQIEGVTPSIKTPESKASGRPSNGRVSHMVMLLRDFEMSKGLCDETEFCAWKALDNGLNLIVTSASSKKLPISSQFKVGVSDSMNTDDSFVIVEKENLEEEINKALNSKNVMKP